MLSILIAPLFEVGDKFVRGLYPPFGVGWPELFPHQHAFTSAFNGLKSRFVGQVVAQVGDPRARRRRFQNRVNSVALASPGKPEFQPLLKNLNMGQFV